MKTTLILIAAAIALSACATGQPITALAAKERTREDVREERARDGVRHMQDEFNALNGEQ